MLDRFSYMEGHVNRMDDQLQTLQEACSYQWNELHESNDSDMYDINTRLSSLMMAQGAQTAHFAGSPFQDPRGHIAELEAQREREREGSRYGGKEIKEKIILLV